MHQFNLGLLVLRGVLGVFVACHGFNKFFGGGRIAGTTRWFGSIGMKWPAMQARIAATTEIGAGLLLAAGLLTPLAAAGIIGLMFVAFYVAHRKVGFFVFLPDQGWEYVAAIAVGAWTIATVGPGEWSLDHALDIEWHGWWPAIVAGVLGLGGGITQLLISYRPPRKDD